MKTAIKLVLIYLGILQIIAPIIVMIPCGIYLFATAGTLDQAELMQIIIIPAQLTGILLMTLYLWKAGYISKEKVTWSPVSFSYLGWSLLILLASICLITNLIEHMKWLPNLMENVFDILQSGWVGILTIAVIGPVLEELLFRGAITKALLKQYSPVKAILISAVIFGVFHINPAQIIPAFLIGILFGWVYYKTASLIPCILMHILNNSLAVYMNIKYPDVEDMGTLLDDGVNLMIVGVATVLFVVCYMLMKRTSVPYPWKKEENVEVITNND